MDTNSIRIGDTVHSLANCVLFVVPQEGETGRYLSIDLNASAGRDTAGLAINCLSLFEITSIDQLEGLQVRFSREEDDPRIELAESVISKPGFNVFDLEISTLSLQFGRTQSGRISVELVASCFTFTSGQVAVSAKFDATIEERR